MQNSPLTSLSLIERARSREDEAWEKLVDLYGPLVHYWCRQAKLADADLPDVFQDVFQSVAQHLPRFRRDREGDTFRGWLRTITRSRIMDHFRRRQKEPVAPGGSVAQNMIQALPDPLAVDESSEVDLVSGQIHKALQWIREDIEERTWQAFWAIQMDNCTPQEVAEKLGMTAAAVRKARYRVLARLREELAELLD